MINDGSKHRYWFFERAKDSHTGKISGEEFDAAAEEFKMMVIGLHKSPSAADKAVFKHLQEDVNAGLDALGYTH